MARHHSIPEQSQPSDDHGTSDRLAEGGMSHTEQQEAEREAIAFERFLANLLHPQAVQPAFTPDRASTPLSGLFIPQEEQK